MPAPQKNFTSVSATEATQKTAELLGRVRYGKELVLIHHHNQPSVVMVPFEMFAEQGTLLLGKADQEAFLKALENPPPPNAALKQAVQKFEKDFA